MSRTEPTKGLDRCSNVANHPQAPGIHTRQWKTAMGHAIAISEAVALAHVMSPAQNLAKLGISPAIRTPNEPHRANQGT